MIKGDYEETYDPFFIYVNSVPEAPGLILPKCS